MKKQEEKLRDFVKTMRAFWVLAYPYDLERPDDGSKIAELRNRMDELLDATSTPEMEQLIEWIQHRVDSYIGRETPPGRAESFSVSPVRRQELELVLGHIRREHGYAGPQYSMVEEE